MLYIRLLSTALIICGVYYETKSIFLVIFAALMTAGIEINIDTIKRLLKILGE